MLQFEKLEENVCPFTQKDINRLNVVKSVEQAVTDVSYFSELNLSK